MVIQYSTQITDKHIGPSASAFTAAEIPDMSSVDKEAGYYLQNYFLNSVYTATYKPPMNAYVHNFLAKTQFAFEEHRKARDATLALLSSEKYIYQYAKALFHWECFVGLTWHAYKTLATMAKDKVFENGDGSIEQRLNKIYNQMKHAESCIESGQLVPGAPVPVWLVNTGLQSIDTVLTFAETGEVLNDLATYANQLMNPKG